MNKNCFIIIAVCALFLSSCKEELVHNLDEATANEIVLLLGTNGVAAHKKQESALNWMIQIPYTQQQRALMILTEEGIPRYESNTFTLLNESSGLIPSSEETRLRRFALLSRELEESLLSINGIVDAHVHVDSVTESRSFFDQPLYISQASVLIVQKSGITIPTDEEIRVLIQGQFATLEEENISVLRSIMEEKTMPEINIVSFGPFGVIGESASGLRALFLTLILSLAILSSSCLFLILQIWQQRYKEAKKE